MSNEEESKLALFDGREMRQAYQDGEWWFSIIDVIEALVGGDRPRKYWNDLKKKLLLEGYDQLSEKIGQLKMKSSDGKFYMTDCATSETLFRIIQSIPSPKVEPLKRWLAQDGRAHQNQGLAAPPFAKTSQRLTGSGLALFVRLSRQAGDEELGFDESGHGRYSKMKAARAISTRAIAVFGINFTFKQAV